MKVKVGFNFLRVLNGGNLEFAVRLLSGLAASELLDVTVIARPETFRIVQSSKINVRCTVVNPKVLGPWSVPIEIFYINRILPSLRPDVFFSPNTLIPFHRLGGIPVVVVVHDLNFLTIPMNPMRKLYKIALYKYSMKKANKVVCVSRFTAEQLRKFVGYRYLNKITVVYNGVDDSWILKPVLPIESRKLRLIAFAHYRHKNVDIAMEACQLLLRRGRKFNLSIVGGLSDSYHRELRRYSKKLKIESIVKFEGRISRERLVQLYRESFCLLFPSSFEGFGLPVIEAMALGCPVISSAAGALPEVCGEAAILVNPNAERIANAVEILLGSPTTYKKQVGRGRERCKKFLWSTAIAQYENILLSTGR